MDDATEVCMKWRDIIKSKDSETHLDFAIAKKDIHLFNSIPWRDRLWTVVCTTNFYLNANDPSPEMAKNILADLVNRPKFHIDGYITKVVKRNDYSSIL